jgi:hypothetical protein
MQKTIIIFMLAIAGAAIFTGCKKEAPSISTDKVVSLTKIDSDLKAINAKYISGKAGAKTTSIRGWAAAGVDLGAAASLIGLTWSWCATGWGGIAAGVVVVFGTAGASAAAYNGSCVTNNTPPTTIIDQKNEIIANVGTYVIPNPYNNPYDSIGQQHNLCVKMWCQQSTPFALTQSTLIYTQSDLASTQLAALAYDTGYIAYNTLNYVVQNNIGGSGSLNTFLNYQLASDTTLLNIEGIFTEALSECADLPTTMSLINAYENYFLNTQTNVTATEQAALLTSFSVGKYSTAMWSDALSVN